VPDLAHERLRCESYVKRYLNNSPMVRFLIDALQRSSASQGNDTHCAVPQIRCVPCPESVAATGTFEPDRGIILCQNFIDNGLQAEDTLSHELIHAFDNCRVDFDAQNCRHLACTEIRAANLSGDCRWSRELFRGKLWENGGKLAAQHQACVRRRALLSLKSNPGCKTCPDLEKLVDEVFEPCFSDTEPFLDIP
jgi:inner membrane protease ATP23